jgi:hypothetical protein
MTDDQAVSIILDWLRSKKAKSSQILWGFYFDLYIPQVINEVLQAMGPTPESYQYDHRSNSAVFFDAAWTLCLRGILRPANYDLAQGSTPVPGNAFSLTSYGKRWIAQSSQYEVTPSEYSKFGQILSQHSPRFGAGFHSRSQEALNCYQAHAYLACCAMCGAAAESILLALAIQKQGNETEVLDMYRSSGGRSRVEKKLLGQQDLRIQQSYKNYSELLKYWRDDASHGMASSINEEEAFTSIMLLLRFAQFADNNWGVLTTP